MLTSGELGREVQLCCQLNSFRWTKWLHLFTPHVILILSRDVRGCTILLNVDCAALVLFARRKFWLNSRHNIVDHHLSVLISINTLLLEFISTSSSVDTHSLCHHALSNRPDANLSIPPSALWKSARTSHGTQKHNFCDVPFVADLSVWWFLFITDNDVGLAISAEEEPLLINTYFIEERHELGACWPMTCCCCV